MPRAETAARPWPPRIVSLASELFWLVVMAMTIPVAVLVVMLPVALVAKLLLLLVGSD